MEHIIDQNKTAIILAIIALGATFLTLATQIILALIQKSMRKEQKELKVMVDGRLTDLLESNKVKDQALGRETGRAEQKAETKNEVNINPIKVEIETKPPATPEK